MMINLSSPAQQRLGPAARVVPPVGTAPQTLPPGAAVRRPAAVDLLLIAVSTCILTYAWRVQDLFPLLAKVKLPILATLGMYGLYAMTSDRRRKLRSVVHPVTKCLIVIMALAVASVPTSLYKGMSFGFIKDDLGKSFLLMIILAASVRALEDVRRYVAAVVAGAAIYAGYVYLYVDVGISGRLGDLAYYDANDLGMLMVCTLPLATYFVIRGRTPFARIASVLATGIFLLVIVKSGSRGAFLGLIGFGLYLLLGYSAIPKKLRVGAVIACFLGLLLAGNETYWSMMRTILNPSEDYNWSGNSESGRMEVWKRGIGYMLRRPLTGVGARAFPVAEGQLSPLAERQQYGMGVKWSAAHNSFVEIGAELGVFGLITFVLLLVHAYKAARGVSPGSARDERASDAVFLGQALAGTIVGYVICGFFLSQAYAAYMFIIYGLIVGLAKATGSAPTSAQKMARAPRVQRRAGVADPSLPIGVRLEWERRSS
mgnify:CR=1 FL=1